MKKILMTVTIVGLLFCLTACSGNDLEEMYVPSKFNVLEVSEEEE